ncbi:MAG: hypothetical protein C4346_15870, partial [Chloroflexota bacterium]
MHDIVRSLLDRIPGRISAGGRITSRTDRDLRYSPSKHGEGAQSHAGGTGGNTAMTDEDYGRERAVAARAALEAGAVVRDLYERAAAATYQKADGSA